MNSSSGHSSIVSRRYALRWAWGEEIPSPEGILEDAGVPGHVIEHSRVVCVVAGMYAGSGFADPELVATAALLHDIGRSQSHGLDHAQIGALILRKMGISEDIAGIVERHIGGGLSADECSLLGLLPRDCIPRSPEEKIVCHADNIVKGRKMITIEERLQLAIHLPKKVRRRMYRLAREVELFR